MVALVKEPNGWVTVRQLSLLAAKYVANTGIPSSIVISIALVESAGVAYGEDVYLNPNIINSIGYKGLFQFDPRGSAWQQAADNKMGIKLEGFSTGWNKPEEAVKAVMVYARQNFDTFKKLSGYAGPITPEIIYLSHNQGAAGAAGYVTSRRDLAGTQSRAAVTLALAAKKQYQALLA